MKWLEISVTTDGETAEAVVELFNRYGRGQSVIETPLDCFEYELVDAPLPSAVIIRTYLPLDRSAADARQRIQEGLWHLSQIHPIPEPIFRELSEEDWSESWKAQYHRLRVGHRIVIVPAWEEYAPSSDEIFVRLEPGMAFGTGLHPTTRLCLEALETELVPGAAVLDVGTGSGVLAIAAAKFGARSVLAMDADPVAVGVARENVVANGAGATVKVQHGSLPGGDAVPMRFSVDRPLPLLESGEYDLVLVNILAPVIIGMAPALSTRLCRPGRLVAAGLIQQQEADVVDALQQQGLTVIRQSQEDDWVCLVAQKG